MQCFLFEYKNKQLILIIEINKDEQQQQQQWMNEWMNESFYLNVNVIVLFISLFRYVMVIRFF